MKSSISLNIALLPLLVLIGLLAFNVIVYGDDALSGSNQFILLLGGALAAVVGFANKISYKTMLDKVSDNLKSVTGAILILLFVGALAGTWLISGVIPAMIYYGLQILHPSIFLPACVIICALISLATGSSWTTSATVGIALIGIGKALGVSVGMVAGAVLSGAYFGDKLSPLSDTTNLAPAMAGADLFAHIRYMTHTTVPSIVVTLIVFIILSIGFSSDGSANSQELLTAMNEVFTINLFLFIVPILVIVMIVRKTPPLVALFIGTLLGALATLIFQQELLLSLSGESSLSVFGTYQVIMDAITVSTEIETTSPALSDLFQSGGMKGMLGTIWLIICAMVFGGVMDAIGALATISSAAAQHGQVHLPTICQYCCFLFCNQYHRFGSIPVYCCAR
jgi:NhaC family Na+:H+ antiporter